MTQNNAAVFTQRVNKTKREPKDILIKFFCLAISVHHAIPPTEMSYMCRPGTKSSVTGVSRKKNWGDTDKFYLHLQERIPNKRKKGVHPGRLPSFDPQVLLRGARLLPDGARRDSTVRISHFAHKFDGEEQKKKVFCAKSYAQSWRSGVFFVLERNFTHVWEGTNSFLGGAGPEMHSSGTGPVTFFRGSAQSSLGGGHNSRLGGTSNDLGGRYGPKIPS